MPFYSDETLDEVRRANDILDVVSPYVQLRQRGGRYWGLCPFHREKSPSFTVRTDMQTFYCFGCAAGGNVFGFVQRYENLGFVDAVKRLAERARITLPEEKQGDPGAKKLREDIFAANRQAARFFYQKLISHEGAVARDYLLARRIKNSTIKLFGLGFAPGGGNRRALYEYLAGLGVSDQVMVQGGLVVKTEDERLVDKFRGRLMFPILDASERICGFGGRNFDDLAPNT